jgi:acyl-CoA dehydrogenase
MNEALRERPRAAPASDFRLRYRAFLAAYVTPNQDKFRQQRNVDRAVWAKAGELGLLLPDVPVAYGGMGGSFLDVAAIFEERAAADDRSFGAHVHIIAANYILHHGTEEQRRAYLPRLANGEMVAAIAMTEPHAGSDLRAIRTSAQRSGDAYVINGTKTFISNIFIADLLILAVRTGEGAKDLSLLLIEPRDLPGFEIVRKLGKLGQTGQDTCEIRFTDARVKASQLLGVEENRGLHQLVGELPYERTIVSVSACATMERALRLATDYARERIIQGRPLIEMQNARFKLAECKAKATVARVFVDHCVRLLGEGALDAATASIGKLWLSETEFDVVDECLQVFGGNGYIDDHPIGQIFVDARAERIYGGSSEIMKEIIARSL